MMILFLVLLGFLFLVFLGKRFLLFLVRLLVVVGILVWLIFLFWFLVICWLFLLIIMLFFIILAIQTNTNTMKKILKYSLPILMLSVIFSACNEEIDTGDREAQEERYFFLYMDANYPDLEPQESGIYYIPVEEGDGATPDSGDFVYINYVTFTLPDETVADTYDEDWARDNGIYVDGVMYGPYKYQVGSEIRGLDAGVGQMQEGDIARLIFKSDLGYGATGFGNAIRSYESLMIDVELVEVIGNASSRANAEVAAYLDTLSADYVAVLDDETGAYYYYIEDEAGTGDNLKEGDEFTVYYEGSLLDGRVFDSSDENDGGLDVVLGTTSLIRGWTLGLEKFKPGGKGRLLISYELAYGEEGQLASGTSKYSIPPYEPLVFEMTISELEEEEE